MADEAKRVVRREAKDFVTAYPVNSPGVRKQVAREDICPECGGELDTGWECNRCGFDAHPLVAP